MKTILTATAFTLTLSLSGLAHAAFKDKEPTAGTSPATATAWQDAGHLATVNGFKNKSYYAGEKDSASSAGRGSTALGANCALSPTFGFQDSASASC